MAVTGKYKEYSSRRVTGEPSGSDSHHCHQKINKKRGEECFVKREF